VKPVITSTRAILLATTTVFLAACDESDPFAGKMRVIHASSDAPAVNVYFEESGSTANGASPDIEALDYGESSGYASFSAGTYDISVRGILPDSELEVIAVDDFELERGATATFVAINEVAAISGAVAPDSAATPSGGEVALAVFHGATVADAVDVYVTSAPGPDISTRAPNFTFNFGETVDAGALPAGTYEIQIALAGGDTPVYRSGPVDLSPFEGEKLLIAALNTVNDTSSAASPVKLLVANDNSTLTLLDSATETGLRALHLSPDAALAAGGSVEVFASSSALGGTVELIDSFNYLDLVPGTDSYVSVPAGEHTIDVAPDTGTIGDSVYTSDALELSVGQEYTTIASGRLTTSPVFELLALADNNRSIATQASVRIGHAAPAAGEVDIFVTPAGDFTTADVEAGLAGDPLLSAFGVGEVTGYVALNPGQYDVRVVPLSLGVVAINIESLELAAGLAATVVAHGPDEADNDPADFGVVLLTN
jgi:hypothetical protein